jgi:hypothetical protein
MIRINPLESQVPRKTDISLAVGALEGLQGIANAMKPMEVRHDHR